MTPEQCRIQAAREMLKAGAFNKRITGSQPLDLDINELTLECGHTCYAFAAVEPPDHVACQGCAKVWIATAPEAAP